MARFTGKVAVVTGASSGIGKATAETLAAQGAKVVVADVQDKPGEQVVHGITQAGGEATYVHCDVSQLDDVEAMVEAAIDAYGGLDVAVNNAGIEGELAPTAEQPIEAWDRVIDVNLRGVFLCMRSQIPAMLERGGGAIVNVASILGHVAFANAPGYTAAKHGVIGATKTAALEYAEQGIRVNAVCPGFIETPMVMERGVHAAEDEEVHHEIEQLHPMNRMGQPGEIADAICYLASDEASFVTGQSLTPDGGYTAR